jgi:hypothetical protein
MPINRTAPSGVFKEAAWLRKNFVKSLNEGLPYFLWQAFFYV